MKIFKSIKLFTTVFIVFVLMITLLPVKQCRADRYYPGSYEKKLNGTWYTVSMNEYTDGDSKYVGCFYVYPSSEGLAGYVCDGSFYRVKKNKYRYDDKYGSVVFTVKKNKLKVKVKGLVVKDFDFSGTYKLTEKYHPS